MDRVPPYEGGLGPLPGLCLRPTGDIKWSPDPSPTHAHAPPPLTTNPGSAPGWHCRMSAEHRQHPHNQSRHILMKN